MGTDYTYELYKEDDWARGVTLKYINGGYDDGCQTENGNRQFTINFVCPDAQRGYEWDTTNMYKFENLEGLATFDTFVIENEGNKYGDDGKCGYFIEIKNSLACPWQCITPVNDKEFQICSGHGKCAADPYAGLVRCICDYGFIGDDCNIPSTTQELSSQIIIIKRYYGWLIFGITIFICCIIIILLQHIKYSNDLKHAINGANYMKKYEQNLINQNDIQSNNITNDDNISDINIDTNTVNINDDNTVEGQ